MVMCVTLLVDEKEEMNEFVLLHIIDDLLQIYPATGHVFKDNPILD